VERIFFHGKTRASFSTGARSLREIAATRRAARC